MNGPTPKKVDFNYEKLIAEEKDLLCFLRKISVCFAIFIINAILVSTDWIWAAKMTQTNAAQLCYVFSEGRGKSRAISALDLYLPDPVNANYTIQVGRFDVSNYSYQLPDRNLVKNTEKNPFNSYFLKARGDFHPDLCVTLHGIQVKVAYKQIITFPLYLKYVPIKVWIEGREVYDDEQKDYLFEGRLTALLFLIIALFIMQTVTWPLRTVRRKLKQITNSNAIK